jgi:hypothetical protein
MSVGDSLGVSLGDQTSSPIGGRFWVLSDKDDGVDDIDSTGEPPPYGWSSPEPSPFSRYVKRIRNRFLQREASLHLTVDLSPVTSGSSHSDDLNRLTKPLRPPLPMNERQSSVAAHVEVLLSSLALNMDRLYIIISLLAEDVMGWLESCFWSSVKS